MFKTLLLNLKNERKIYILGSASVYWKEDGSTWMDGPSIINQVSLFWGIAQS